MSGMEEMDIGAEGNMDTDQQETGRGDAQPEAAAPSGLSAQSALTVDVGAAAMRCDGCSQPYNGQGRAPLTGQCGHTSCEGCWTGGSMVCGRCNATNSRSQLQPTFPVVPRDLLSPPNVDPPSAIAGGAAGSMNNTDHKVATSVTTGTQQQPAASTTTRTATATASRQASATAAAVPGGDQDADVCTIEVMCLNGTKLKLTVNTRTTTVTQLKAMIEEKSRISTARMRLLHLGKVLNEPSRTLKTCRIVNGSRLSMAENTCYGG